MERRLKERLIGAAVLVLLAVIFIPMLLNDNTQYNSEITGSNIPERPSDEFNTRIIPLDKSETPQQETPQAAVETGVKESAPTVAPSLEPATQVSAPDTTQAQPHTPPSPVTTEQRTEATVPQDKAMGVRAWIVQLGSFSSEKNAQELNTKLRGKGYTAFVEPLKQKSGVIYRVRVGPELLRSDADKVRDKIKKSMQMDGLVIPYP